MTDPDAPTSPAPATPRHHVLAAVALGGALGTLARAGLAEAQGHDPSTWPWGTLVANLVGTFLLGWWTVRLTHVPDLDPRFRPFLTTGICGGLTTFSTLQLELVRQVDDGRWALAAGYGAVTLVGGLLTAVAGHRAARARRRSGTSAT
ncbi:fluoride efflux transporter CrcB [Patulibacter brassicae]|jgi:CrcB protein|uniref:Fluoride-specific ion channel FluC n=1 Tax=Patulibacter brassicae TaxID=1705717 RepID=A0ABU4VPM6_9ACTN|nr:fluoride efflux transporter CrcB [Patulibacter brassicae]MDX8153807.1 fluoride efflux transporter CrcB [Patulibacter brassicae]